jgi:hypothetical protein
MQTSRPSDIQARYSSVARTLCTADKGLTSLNRTLVPLPTSKSTAHGSLWRTVASYEATCSILAISFLMAAELVS